MKATTMKASVLALTMVTATAMTALAGQSAQPASAAPAASTAAAAKPAAKGRSDVLEDVWGEIDHIGSDMKSIFVRDHKGQVREVKLAANAKVSAGPEGKPVKLSQLKKGDRVRIQGRAGKGQSVEVLLVGPSRKQLLRYEMAHPRRFAVVSRIQTQGLEIMSDVDDGVISGGQAEKLIGKLDAVRTEERKLAKEHGGYLDRGSYARLQGELNKAGSSRHQEAMGTAQNGR